MNVRQTEEVDCTACDRRLRRGRSTTHESWCRTGAEGGRAAPTTFHPVTDVRVVANSDDFTFAGTKVELVKVQTKTREWYDVNVRGTLTRAVAGTRVRSGRETSTSAVAGTRTERGDESGQQCSSKKRSCFQG